MKNTPRMTQEELKKRIDYVHNVNALADMEVIDDDQRLAMHNILHKGMGESMRHARNLDAPEKVSFQPNVYSIPTNL